MAMVHTVIADPLISCAPGIPVGQRSQGFPVTATNDDDDSDHSNLGNEDIDSEDETSRDEETKDDSDVGETIDSKAEDTDDGDDESLDKSTVEGSDDDHAPDDGYSEKDSEAEDEGNSENSSTLRQQIQIQPVGCMPQGPPFLEAPRQQPRQGSRNHRGPVEVTRTRVIAQVCQNPAQVPRAIVPLQQQPDQREVVARQLEKQQRSQRNVVRRGTVR
ncbi:hypothetical protein G6011_00454 [Alternaria panax]|uniref:Uncharacterized protein n=1 Tax=Alternaria panax TaxID=48097 RepID=A0AAD4IIB1_9PLEO|nr:hypothetical protein G6011_00454 [Alternaria panax]